MNYLKRKLNQSQQIISGWWSWLFPTPTKLQVAEERLSLCRMNICGYYDPAGTSEEAVIPGRESCGHCGCPLAQKTLAMMSYCPLRDDGQIPIWEEANKFKDE